MNRATPRRLVVPALFSVLTIATACGDGGGSGGSGTTGTTSGPGGAGGTGGRGGGGGGNPLDQVDCSARDNKKDCVAMSIHACSWASTTCVQDCMQHMDKAGCNGDIPCMWFSGTCEMPI